MASLASHAVVALSIGACFYKPGIPKRVWVIGVACSILPDLDVVGLILRPEDDGRYAILGVADLEGKPSVPDSVQAGDHLVAVDGIPVGGSTMGQVWAMLGGTPGQERKLTIERGGRQFTAAAQVQHFLAELPDEREKKKK